MPSRNAPILYITRTRREVCTEQVCGRGESEKVHTCARVESARVHGDKGKTCEYRDALSHAIKHPVVNLENRVKECCCLKVAQRSDKGDEENEGGMRKLCAANTPRTMHTRGEEPGFSTFAGDVG